MITQCDIMCYQAKVLNGILEIKFQEQTHMEI